MKNTSDRIKWEKVINDWGFLTVQPDLWKGPRMIVAPKIQKVGNGNTGCGSICPDCPGSRMELTVSRKYGRCDNNKRRKQAQKRDAFCLLLSATHAERF